MEQGLQRFLVRAVVALLAALPVASVGTGSKAGDTAGHKDCDRVLAQLPGQWDKILQEAKGQQITWWLWSGDAAVNRYADEWVATKVKEKFGIELKRVGIKDTVEGVQQVIQEKTAGKHIGGAVDLNWISSENLKTMIQGDMLCTKWPTQVPDAKYLDFNDRTISHQGALFVGDNALAWSRYQYVFVYDSANVKNLPSPHTISFKQLAEWIKANPGKFTYPAPPDFTGRGILFSLLYEISGDYKIWQGDFDKDLWAKWSPKMWEYLNDIKPHLWRNGETYPENVAALERLYSTGEVWWSVSAYFATPGRNVDKGVFPKTTQTLVAPVGTLSGTGAVSIPYNSKNKAAAMVVANFLASPEAQYEKSLPTGVADGTILSMAKLTPEWVGKFKNLPRHPTTLPLDVLGAHQVPSGTHYIVPLEQDWRKFVLKKQ